MRASGDVVDRHTVEAIERGQVQLRHIEDLPRHPEYDAWVRDGRLNPAEADLLVDPVTGEPVVVRHLSGGFVQRPGEIFVRRNLPPDRYREVLRHEVNHALRRPLAPGDVLTRYRMEFDAYWTDGRFAHLSPADRAEAIRLHILGNYPDIAKALPGNDPLVRKILEYRVPSGNILNSPTWARVERLLGDQRDVKAALKALREAAPADRAALAAEPAFRDLLRRQLKARDYERAIAILDG